MSVCRNCGQQITWKRTATGVWLALDPAPVSDGNVILTSTGHAREIEADERRRYPGPIFKIHYVSCASAAEHRKR